ncbi:MAG: hypothetical protein U0361_15740 [Nitrospiraceae bacterium]
MWPTGSSRLYKAGHQVVVVLSAMSGGTDRLLKLAHEVTSTPDERELDMLLSTGERVTISLLAMDLRGQYQRLLVYRTPSRHPYGQRPYQGSYIAGDRRTYP